MGGMVKAICCSRDCPVNLKRSLLRRWRHDAFLPPLFGPLTADMQMEIPVTCAAFVASRKSMLGIQINQHSLLSWQLSIVWQQHYWLCKSVPQKEECIRGSCKRTSFFGGRGEAETSSLWSKTADDFHFIPPTMASREKLLSRGCRKTRMHCMPSCGNCSALW
ncbi:hypothetical protein TraAM80_03363 [Trypanosoma rangeli]|uniref:Uncharacterized protein n=1 Tax=Trypanosoma rangeli TaxID=5698 RepID=A0A3R7NTP6_TRYRA|nr:uncharacterized protein TraAM80_03363 [Trypanosoma rangeli]RNF07507.1 hypothetical protein TraAM80_03363 [Trypanosoma rangeli]|eukprot:RNF07507.1 hypothetical protein TraAM80_03363 [Trypanosoma rangeli]